jgi:hypothetical protein
MIVMVLLLSRLCFLVVHALIIALIQAPFFVVIVLLVAVVPTPNLGHDCHSLCPCS